MRTRPGTPATCRRHPSTWAAPVVLAAISTALTFAARDDGPFPGEVGLTLWMHRNTPGPVDAIGGLLDPLLTDLTAPAVLTAVVLLTWWRWGRHAAIMICASGALTALTRIGDLVQRPRPTPSGAWSSYRYGNGGYPSGHVIFTVLVLGTVVVLARRYSTSAAARLITSVVGLLVAVMVWTRVSRLEHWPLDVIGGLTMATSVLCVMARLVATGPGATRSPPDTTRTRVRWEVSG